MNGDLKRIFQLTQVDLIKIKNILNRKNNPKIDQKLELYHTLKTILERFSETDHLLDLSDAILDLYSVQNVDKNGTRYYENEKDSLDMSLVGGFKRLNNNEEKKHENQGGLPISSKNDKASVFDDESDILEQLDDSMLEEKFSTQEYSMFEIDGFSFSMENNQENGLGMKSNFDLDINNEIYKKLEGWNIYNSLYEGSDSHNSQQDLLQVEEKEKKSKKKELNINANEFKPSRPINKLNPDAKEFRYKLHHFNSKEYMNDGYVSSDSTNKEAKSFKFNVHAVEFRPS